MKLYKFKSLANFEYVADIIINKRLYAADFTELNDPMEGFLLLMIKKNSLMLLKMKN